MNISTTLRFYLSFAFVIGSNLASAQTFNPLNLYSTTPPTPEVAALGKYVTSPVSYSTGVPDISVPLYTVESGSLKIPVSLAYNASGIKVEEVATSVGLGWSLNTGASLYRVIRGKPDDFNTTNGYMYTSRTVKSIVSTANNSTARSNAYNDIQSGVFDGEPDIYYFSVMGYSGRFYFDQQLRQFVMTPRQRVKIDYTVNSNSNIDGFILTLPNGTKCYFGKSKDGTRSAYDSSGNQMVTSFGLSGVSISPSDDVSAVSTWQVMDILSSQNEAISYYYTTVQATDFGRGGERKFYAGTSGCAIPNNEVASGTTYVQTSTKSVLNKISGNLVDVLFQPSQTARQDIVAGPGELDKIVIQNKSAQILKSYILGFDYWISPAESYSLPFATTSPTVQSVSTKRLYLKSVTESDANGNVLPPYVFSYNSTANLPSRLSSAQDFWGYYNGKQNGISLVPKVLASLVNSGSTGYLTGADRTTDTIFNQANLLQTIKYPTGGSTTYEYESNIVSKSGVNASTSGFQYSGMIDAAALIYKSNSVQQAQDPNQYVYNFTIGNVNTPNPVHIVIQNACANMNSLSCPLGVSIKGITNPSFSLTVSVGDMSTNLPSGQYKLVAELRPTDAVPNPDFTIALTWSEFSAKLGPNSTYAGGVRIKRITKQIGTSPALVTSYAYNSFANPTQTSGLIFNFPASAFTVPCGLNSSSPVLEVSSQSAIPLNSSDGQVLRYTNVAEFSENGSTKLKSEYDFDWNNDYVYSYPFPDNIKADWESGTLLEKRDFKSISGTQYNLLNRKSWVYNSMSRAVRDTIGMKLISWATPGTYGIGIDKAVTEWYLPRSETTISYLYNSSDQQLSSITDAKTFSYNKQFILSRTDGTSSKGEQITEKSYFPADFNSVSGFNVNNLVANNILETPLRQEISRNGKLTSGRVMNYNDAGQIINVFNYENTNLSDTTGLDPNVILPAAYYTNRITNTYNAGSRIVSVLKDNHATKTILWGYNNEYPIVEIENATYNDVAGALSQTVIDQLQTTTDDNQIRNQLGALRTKLSNAKISIYTYKPGVGLSSITDAKALTTYYEYDAFQRLMDIKDNDGNIIKYMDYHYQNQ
ncbi:hypothetical protein [Pedobacter sp. L105]|uniref:hypothetical protein n=1 Tax=Pedobacter sp. L105 TaxID=1641871 RepID=UPI00131B97E7|nr:hypothetical protein [Pedobacter sp. L105]